MSKDKKRIYKKPNGFIYFLYRMISKFLSRFAFNAKVIKNELKGVKGPYVVIANHESAIDFINAAAAIKRRAHFVISNSFFNTMPIKGLIKMAGVIPKQQFQTSVTDLRKMKTVIDNNMPLIIYPVGLMSENGVSDPCPFSTSKFVKFMNADVYICYSRGSYLTKPKWSKVNRKGKITVEIFKLFDKQQLGKLSENEIYEAIENKICYDAYKNNEEDKVEYKNGDNLKGLEYVLFKCPNCHNEKTIISEGKTILKCSCCGYEVRGNKYGFLDAINGNQNYFSHPGDWYYSFYNEYKDIIEKGEEITLENKVNISMINYKRRKYEQVGNGVVKINKNNIVLTGKINEEKIDKTFSLINYPCLPFMPGRYVDIQEGQEIYRLSFEDKYDVTKFVMLVKIYHNLLKKQ